ncbi:MULTISPECIES: SRPBCC family protein [Pontibacillus]|uniref:SRPBCC family protein n=1 Tax=Pontibacillus chungwhensis TaxID=265426 RepID=A0ABY8UU43_9BACI|nr:MULTISPECIES: SRPBCC family protein [Pontibacillus]MCD5323337.1 SRPBCC family protein [Pontibacillus sp. HN14]WIF96718.1 SRPBCC family protein [Pontibacillus chungwhensis]
MIKWHEERVLPFNIEVIWRLFEIESLPRIMPNVIETKVLDKKDGVVGTTYEQKYKEGKRIETYIVEDLEYENTPQKKHNKIGFTLAKAFDIQASFTLIKQSENETRFIYKGQNVGLNFLGKTLLKLGGQKNNQKVVDDFMDRVEKEAMVEDQS